MHNGKGNKFLYEMLGLLYLFFHWLLHWKSSWAGDQPKRRWGEGRKRIWKKVGRGKLKLDWNSLQGRIIRSLTQSQSCLLCFEFKQFKYSWGWRYFLSIIYRCRYCAAKEKHLQTCERPSSGMIQSQTLSLPQWLKFLITFKSRCPVLSVMKGQSRSNMKSLCAKATRARLIFKGVSCICSARRCFEMESLLWLFVLDSDFLHSSHLTQSHGTAFSLLS